MTASRVQDSVQEQSPLPAGKRPFGRTGWLTSEIGFGGWGIGGSSWGGPDDPNSRRALKRAFDLGITFFDTAHVYGYGHSERLIADELAGHRQSIFVATKIPPKNMLWPARLGVRLRDAYPLSHVKKCTEQSLKNLNRETIDLQQFHVWNSEWVEESDEWRESIDWLKRSGKARFVGISGNDHSPETLVSAVSSGLIDSVQVIYNIFDPSPGDELLPLCQKLGIAVVARVPFDEGSLTGTLTPGMTFAANDMRSRYFAGDRLAVTCERVRSLTADLSGEETLTRTALRFCLSEPSISTVIPGMRKVSHVEENVRASKDGPLLPATLEMLKKHRWSRNFY